MFNIKVGDIVELIDGTIGKCTDINDGKIRIGDFMEFISPSCVLNIVASVTVSYNQIYEVKKINSCMNCRYLNDKNLINRVCKTNLITIASPFLTICEGWEKNETNETN